MLSEQEEKVIRNAVETLEGWVGCGFKDEEGFSPMWNPTLRTLRNLLAQRTPEQPAPATTCPHVHPLRQMRHGSWEYACADCGTLIQPAQPMQKVMDYATAQSVGNACVQAAEQPAPVLQDKVQSRESDGPCWECGTPCECWFADSNLWNRVNGNETGLLCLRCFVNKAENMGLNRWAWKLMPEIEQPAPKHDGDVVERMMVAWFIFSLIPDEDVQQNHVRRMTAALAEARRGMVTLEEVEKAIQEIRNWGRWSGNDQYAMDKLREHLMTRLAPKQEQKP